MSEQSVKQAVGQALRAMREETGATQEEVADAMGVTRVTVSRWEHGHRTPDVNHLHTYTNVLGSSPAALYANVEVPPDDELTAKAKGLAKSIKARRRA